MKFLFDLFPVILFFVAYKIADIYTATMIAIIATVGQIGWVWFKHRKIDGMQWASLGLIVVFGGATLLLHDENFIKWKPTVLYWLFAVVLVGSALLFKKNLIRSAMEHQVQLPDAIWSKLNWSWAGFFAVMGTVNLWVARNFSSDTWVNFKLFGSLGLMLVFVTAQSYLLSKYIDSESPESSSSNEAKDAGQS
ncbi:MAG: septation protein A [Burkholderiaceae bacterium]|nr:MAG: septation protein A [Burkholderiaceae bacterium]